MVETADALNDCEWVADSLSDIVWQIFAISTLSDYLLDLNTAPQDAIP